MTIEDLVYNLSSLSFSVEFDELESEYSLETTFREECNECEYSGREEFILKNTPLNFNIAMFYCDWSDGDIDSIQLVEIYNQIAFETFISRCKDVISIHIMKRTFDWI